MKQNMFRLFLSPLIILLFISISSAQPGNWTEPVNICHTDWISTHPDMAVGSDGSIHVVWEDGSRLEGNVNMMDILYNCFEGGAWGEPEMISSHDTTYSLSPSIAVDAENRPHVVWGHHAIFPDADIYYTVKTDSGWTEPFNLTAHVGTSGKPDIAIDSEDKIHIVWTRAYNYNECIFYTSYDGENWSQFTCISDSTTANGDSRIVVDSQNIVHVVWRAYVNTTTWCDLFYAKSDGQFWGPILNLTPNDSVSVNDPDIAVDSQNNPHVVWYDVPSFGLFRNVCYTYFNGVEWEPPENITNLMFNSIYCPKIDIDSQDTKFVLFSGKNDNCDPYVHYMYCADSTWSYPDTLYDGLSNSFSAIYISNDVPHVCMQLGINYGDIGYTYFQQQGQVNNNILIACFYQNVSVFPNPFNSRIQIQFNIYQSADMIISIYNMYGQFIKELENDVLSQGEHMIIWDGTDKFGIKLSNGIYFVRLQTNSFTSVKRIILIK